MAVNAEGEQVYINAPDSTRVAQQQIIGPIQRSYTYVGKNDEAEKSKYVPTAVDTPDFAGAVTNSHYAKIKTELENLKSQSRESIKQVQKDLANQGYFDSELYFMSKDQVKLIQQKLKQRGLYTKNIDGIIGSGTLNAWRQYNVDGLVGKRTERALSNKFAPEENYKYEGHNDDTGCAEFVTHHFNNITGSADKAGVTGDAWTMLGNIVKKGGSYIYNIYTDPRMQQARTSVKEMRNLTNQILNEKPLDLKTLKIGDIVGLYNPGSSYQEQANKSGTTYNTHVGIVVGYDKDGTPLIQHNLHRPGIQQAKGSDILTERADRLGKRRISAVARPAYSPVPGASWNSTESPWKVAKEKDNDNLTLFRNSAAGFGEEYLKNMFPNVDNKMIQKMALEILQRETGMMNNTQSLQRSFSTVRNNPNAESVKNFITSNARQLYHRVAGTDPRAVSSDLTKTKLTSFTGEELRFLGLHSPGDLDDPVKAGAAVTYLLSKYNNYFKKYSKEHPELKLTDEDIENATIKAYNSGLSALKSLGYDDKSGEYAPWELEALRRQGDQEGKIYDYAATNWYRILKHFPLLNNKIRSKYESDENNAKAGYAGAAKNAGDRYISSAKYGGKMNYIDFFKNGKKIPKGEVGLRMHSPNIQATVTIPFDRKPSLRFNLSDNINTVNFRNSNKNHDSSFGIGGSYNFDNNSGSLSGSLSYSNNQLPSPISISGFQQFGNPVNIQIPSIDGSINNDRITQLVKFLKSKGKDTNNLSRQDLAVLEKQFQNQSGDDVLRSYDQMSGLFKSGGGIHIKKKNRGKFTASAKAAGESVQEHAHKVMNDPSATTLQKKRANFAIQAKRWAHKHQTGGIVKGASGLKTSTTYFSAVHPEFGNDLSSFSMETRLPRVVGITPDYMKQYDIPVIETEEPVEEDIIIPYAEGQSPATTSGSRGYRNNNPGNIRISDNAWKGKRKNNTDGTFEQFDTMADGYAALFKLLRTYNTKYHLDTPMGLISRYAPASDRNNTASYAKKVASALGIGVNSKINFNDEKTLIALAKTIAMVENGSPADERDIIAGLNLAKQK